MDALLRLSLEKGYDAVTIRDITDRADIAYSTFFRHYTSKDDLLATEIKSVIDDLQNLLAIEASDAEPAPESVAA